jgi:hypothetical protein
LAQKTATLRDRKKQLLLQRWVLATTRTKAIKSKKTVFASETNQFYCTCAENNKSDALVGRV